MIAQRCGDSEMCKSYVGYFRVSTAKQGKSGLGLDAQKADVAAFIAARGTDAKLLAGYTEVESGKRDANRPALAEAMEHARLTGATLLIAKLDRLSRDAHFLLGLQKAGVAFIAADMPHADNFTVGVLALVAQKEREAISARTKAALVQAAAKVAKDGQRKHPNIKRLGNPNGAAHFKGRFQPNAVKALKGKADERAKDVTATIEAIRAEGVTSANGIAAALSARDISTPRGGRWSARTVLNVLARL
jgi:DNA invertase Pin-like site-specific DNA recombinase